MPLGLGLASSHAPSMFAAPEDWPRIYETLTRGVPQPPEAADETPEVIATYVQRIRKNLRTLREQLDAYRPDAIIIVGDDQREVFGPAFRPLSPSTWATASTAAAASASPARATTTTTSPCPATPPSPATSSAS